MKYLSLVCLVSALSLSSCATSPQAHNHWHIDSTGPRVGLMFLGHESNDGYELSSQIGGDMSDIGLTLKRHLMHDNPSNPLLPHSTKPAPKPQLPDREFTTHSVQ